MLEEETPVFGREWAFAVSSLLFKAPPIGFCNHHIYFFVFPPLLCYLLFLSAFICLSAAVMHAAAAGGMIVPASLDTERTSLRTVYTSCLLRESCVCWAHRERPGVVERIISPCGHIQITPPLFPYSLLVDNDVRRAIKRRNQQHGSA